jgi:hypothetical protein
MITAYELTRLAGVIKAAQQMPPLPPVVRKRRRSGSGDGAYLDYSKSLRSQTRRNPEAEGAKRALVTGALGTVLGALAGRMMTREGDDRKKMLLGALAGGALGGIPGYMSGKQEAVSENTRLNFLRRLGITRPGELESMESYSPEIVADVRRDVI